MNFALSARTVTLLATFALAGCSSSSSSPSGALGPVVSYAPPSSGCGSFRAQTPSDPDGVFASLPKNVQSDLLGEPEIRRSGWANFKPKHAPPYNVTVIMSGAVNSLQEQLISGLKQRLGAAKEIGKVNMLLTNGVDIPAQIQQMQTAIGQHTDMIILEPLQAEAFNAPIAQAAQAGIPTVTFLSLVNSRYALNVNVNAYLSAAVTASFIARQAKGHGALLSVLGYGTGQTDQLTVKATKNVIGSCPGMTFGGQILGAYNNGLAKGETLKYLATHPGKLAGVTQGGTMAPGIINAFTSSGRPVPPVSDIAAIQGSLAYWRHHLSTYHGIGTGPGPQALVRATVSVVRRTLAGQGPLVNKFFGSVPLITDKNLAQWVPAGAKDTSLVAAEGPASSFLPEAYLNRLFTHGSEVK
ncbi:MAG: substrate-binding domain-containing protein [Actinomycetota bacterium]|nr:substrate-binding domain-containing protein [Actinomycetota bacterium]